MVARNNSMGAQDDVGDSEGIKITYYTHGAAPPGLELGKGPCVTIELDVEPNTTDVCLGYSNPHTLASLVNTLIAAGVAAFGVDVFSTAIANADIEGPST